MHYNQAYDKLIQWLRRLRIIAIAGTSFLLVACSGGGTSAASAPLLTQYSAASLSKTTTLFPTTTAAPSSNPGQVLPSTSAISNVVPVKVAFAVPSTLSALSATHRKLQYISPSNSYLTIVVTPAGGSGTSYGPTSCTTSSCGVTFSTVPGLNTLVFTLTDGVNTLATFSTTQLIASTTLNTLQFSANPVVNSVALTVSAPSLNAGTAATDTVLVNPMDADGNTIIGTNALTDASGNPLALLLSVSNVQAGGFGTVVIQGPLRITASNHAAITAKYDGGWLDHANLAVTSTRPLSGSLTGATITTIPTAVQYSTGITAGANPHGITTGADGNIWFTEYSGGRIGRCTPSGAITEFSSGIVNNGPVRIIEGPDGLLWFSSQNNSYIQRITYSGTISQLLTFTYNGMYGLALGPDGNVWGTEENFAISDGHVIARFTAAGKLTEFLTGISTGAQTYDIASGSDGNLWFTEQTGNRIGRITTNGVVTEFSTGLSAGAQPAGITNGPDGNIWFTEYSGSRIGRITTSGTITEFSTGLTSGSQPRNIITGPDGNLWFNEDSGARIGRITTGGTITEYSNGFGSGRTIELTLGPDGAIWYTDFGDNKIGRFVY